MYFYFINKKINILKSYKEKKKIIFLKIKNNE